MKEKLQTYSRKRNFKNTPEPQGGLPDPDKMNRFVIQKHDARSIHYDFRIQVNDVLVSWAVPKEPVHDPSVKRLAVKVEDHPLDYYDFEGNIPKGNYGAGIVMVWDAGYFYKNEKKEIANPNYLEEKIKKGILKIFLNGKKLKGYFSLRKNILSVFSR